MYRALRHNTYYFGDDRMSLEYFDDNELVYQAKVAAKDIVNAKYEVAKKVGDFLFLAHSEEEFYQRAIAIDQILDSTATRRLASVSDSKAKLVKALYQEWELKHASCESCGSANFNLPERVAFPITPTEQTTGKAGTHRSGRLWDKWALLIRGEEGGPLKASRPFENSGGQQRNTAKDDNNRAKLNHLVIQNSIGRLDDPEVLKMVKPDSVVWMDPYGLYDRNKRPKFDDIRGKKEEAPTPNSADSTNFISMMGRVAGRRDLGNQGIFLTHHKCTGESFRGFNGNTTGAFPQCTHVHHEGDGCGVGVTERTPDGSIQPGCNKQHLVVTAMTPQLFGEPPKQPGELSRLSPIPLIEHEVRDDKRHTPAALKGLMDKAITPEQGEAEAYTNPTQEQVGEVPLDRMFLMPDEAADRTNHYLNLYHKSLGGEGAHPATLDEFQIGDRTHHVGDIVAVPKGPGLRGAETSPNLGVVVGATAHRNGQYTRFARQNGLGANTDNDASRVASTPGEYSLIVHRLHDPISGGSQPNAMDPNTSQILNGVNEVTQHFPSAQVDTVEPFASKNLGKKGPSGPGSLMSRLYDRLKATQLVRNARPQKVRYDKPKTVKPMRGDLDVSSFDLSSLFNE